MFIPRTEEKIFSYILCDLKSQNMLHFFVNFSMKRIFYFNDNQGFWIFLNELNKIYYAILLLRNHFVFVTYC